MNYLRNEEDVAEYNHPLVVVEEIGKSEVQE